VGLKLGLVYRNPCDAVDAPIESEREIQPPSKIVVKRLLESALDTPHGTAIWLLAYSGMRRGEVVALMRDGLDLDKGTVSISQSVARQDSKLTLVPVKSRTSRRMIHLDAATIAVLRLHLVRTAEHRLAAGPAYEEMGLLFPNIWGGLNDPDSITKTWRRLCREAGVRCRLHDLRHHHASALIEAGVHIKAIQTRLGHSSPSLTMSVYSHVTPGMDKAAAEAYADAMNG